MPANAATAPDSTNRMSFVRSTCTPEKCAASFDRPIAYTPRPNGVKCSRTAKTATSRRNGSVMTGIGVPAIFALARAVQNSGKSVTAAVPSSPTARPRKRASVPIVTASEGSPTTVTRKPLNAPPITPTTRAASAASSNGSPACTRAPVTTLDSPTMLPTERSISPVIMMRVIGRAISRIGAMSSSR